MKLLFLTTHNLATNPRLYKEINLAIKAGFEAELICFEFDNWSKRLNENLEKSLDSIKIVSIPAGRKPFMHWFFSVATEIVWRAVGKFISLPLPFLAQAVSRRNNLIINALDRVSVPDWVIGHNPGALYATMIAKKKFGCKAGFDVEDYHPGEGSNVYLQQLCKRLMKSVLPSMNYVSFAAPLIKKAVEEDLGLPVNSWFTLMNLFPGNEFKEPLKIAGDTVRMVWFSQNIDYGRGIELILPVLKKANGKLKLDLIGNINTEFYNGELKCISNVVVHSPMTQTELHRKLSEYDVGLALDFATDFNREVALTNKILAYLQAGLFVLASNTDAQQDLLNSFPEHGHCFDYKSNNSYEVVEKIVKEINNIRSKRQWRYQNFVTYNWETASKQLLSVWSTH